MSVFYDDDYEPFVARVACSVDEHPVEEVTVMHPSDEFHCRVCGRRMSGVAR